MWVRGLKPIKNVILLLLDSVAPHVGAWIETQDPPTLSTRLPRRTPCGCVD